MPCVRGVVKQWITPHTRRYIADLSKYPDGLKSTPDFVKVVDNFEAEYSYIANDATVFYFKSNLKAPRYKIVKYDLSKPELVRRLQR